MMIIIGDDDGRWCIIADDCVTDIGRTDAAHHRIFLRSSTQKDLKGNNLMKSVWYRTSGSFPYSEYSWSWNQYASESCTSVFWFSQKINTNFFAVLRTAFNYPFVPLARRRREILTFSLLLLNFRWIFDERHETEPFFSDLKKFRLRFSKPKINN